MTNEQAISGLEKIRMHFRRPLWEGSLPNAEEAAEALGMAIEALKLDNNSTELDNEKDDLIRRQDALDACLDGWNKGYAEIIRDIRVLPSIQPEQRKGEWIDDSCSECGYRVMPWNNTPFCPRCGAYNGADMRGDLNEKRNGYKCNKGF